MTAKRVQRDQDMIVLWLGPSTNAVFARGYFRAHGKHKDDARLAVRAAVQKAQIYPARFPVNLIFTPFLTSSQRIFDTSNYSLTGKLIEDGLVRAGILEDDTGSYVRKVTWNPGRKTKLKGSYIHLKIEEAHGE